MRIIYEFTNFFYCIYNLTKKKKILHLFFLKGFLEKN